MPFAIRITYKYSLLLGTPNYVFCVGKTLFNYTYNDIPKLRPPATYIHTNNYISMAITIIHTYPGYMQNICSRWCIVILQLPQKVWWTQNMNPIIIHYLCIFARQVALRNTTKFCYMYLFLRCYEFTMLNI